MDRERFTMDEVSRWPSERSFKTLYDDELILPGRRISTGVAARCSPALSDMRSTKPTRTSEDGSIRTGPVKRPSGGHDSRRGVMGDTAVAVIPTTSGTRSLIGHRGAIGR